MQHHVEQMRDEIALAAASDALVHDASDANLRAWISDAYPDYTPREVQEHFMLLRDAEERANTCRYDDDHEVDPEDYR